MQITELKDAEGRKIERTRYYPATQPVLFADDSTKWQSEVYGNGELLVYCEAYVAGEVNLVELAQVEVTVCVGQRPQWAVSLAPLVVQNSDFERRLASLETNEKKRDLSLRFAAVPPHAREGEFIQVYLSRTPKSLGLSRVVLLFGVLKTEGM